MRDTITYAYDKSDCYSNDNTHRYSHSNTNTDAYSDGYRLSQGYAEASSNAAAAPNTAVINGDL